MRSNIVQTKLIFLLFSVLTITTSSCSRQALSFDRPNLNSNHQVSANQQAEATYLIEQALEKERQGDMESVTKLLDQAIELDPNSDRAYSNRGTIYLNLKHYQRAIDDFNEALKINPKKYEAYINRGDAWYNLGEYARAIESYKAGANLKPNESLPYEDLALTLHNLKDYSNALKNYDRALSLSPRKPETYYNRGITFTEVKQYSKALSDYDQAIKLAPTYLAAYINRAVIKEKLQDLPGALADLNRAIELGPDLAKPYVNRADIYARLHNYKAAIQNYDTAIHLNNYYNPAGLFASRGLALSRLGDVKGAIDDTRRAIEIAQQQHDELNENMQVLAKKQLDELLSAGKAGSNFDTGGSNVAELYKTAMKKINEGDLKGSISDFTQLIALMPNEYSNYNNRGIALSRSGDHEQAIKDFTKVVKLRPAGGEGYFNRAVEYILLKDRDKAIQDLKMSDQLLKQEGNIEADRQVQAQLKQMLGK